MKELSDYFNYHSIPIFWQQNPQTICLEERAWRTSSVSLQIYVAPCKRIRNPAIFRCRNPESTIVWSFGMESGIEKVGIRNPKGWNPESRCWNLESRGWDPESRTFVDSLTWGDIWFWTTVVNGRRESVKDCPVYKQFGKVVLKEIERLWRAMVGRKRS